MRYTIIGVTALFATVVIAGVLYFKSINEENIKENQPLEYFLDDSFLISSFSTDQSTQNLFKDYAIFEALLGKKEWAFLKSMYTYFAENSQISFPDDKDFFFSFHERKEHLEIISALSLEKKIEQKQFENLRKKMSRSYHIETIDSLNFLSYTIGDSTNDMHYYIGYAHPILALSSSLTLLEETLSKKSKKLSNKDIEFAMERKRRNSPVNYIFPHKNIPFIESFASDKSNSFLSKLLRDFDGISSWSQNYKSDALILVGESKVNEHKSYLSLFKNQHKTEQNLSKHFPYNTALYWEFSVSDREQFQQDLKKQQTENDDYKNIEKEKEDFKKKYGTDISTYLDQYLGNNFAIVEQSNKEYLGFISLKKADRKIMEAPLFSSLKGDSIKRWVYPSFLKAEYGDVFQDFPRPYVFLTKDVLVLSNQLNTLKEYILSIKNNRMLNGSLAYKNFEKIQSRESNITFFADRENASRIIRSDFKNNVAKTIIDKENYGFHNFYSWSFQLAGKKDGFYSNVYGIYKNESALGLEAEWEYPLKNKAITPPWVFEHSDTSQFIFFQEQDHRVHAVSPAGEKIWSAVFHGKIVGEAIQMSDRSILVVTDKNRLYRFDPDGKPYPGFSLPIARKPTIGVKLLKINNKEVIAIPAEDKPMLYSTGGDKIKSWENINLNGQKIQSLLSINSQLAIGTQQGDILIFDIHGKQIKKRSPSSAIQIKSEFYPEDNNSDDFPLIVSDSAGNIWRYTDEKTDTVFTADFSSKDIVLNYDDELHKVALAHPKGLDILSIPNTNERKSIRLELNPVTQPQLFATSVIGLASLQNRLIYVFNREGSLLNGFPIEGLPGFYYGKINYNSANYVLTFKRDHTLYAYRDFNN